MKAIVIEKFGGEDQLKMADVAVPIPGPSEVLIEIKYASVNPVDWKIRQGQLEKTMPHRFPVTLGVDAAGVIEAAGVNTHQFHVGDKVYAYCRKQEIHDGTYSEYITMDQDKVALMPKNVSYREAAAIPLAGLTAWQALFDHGRLKAGEAVLIFGAAGGVGSFAVQFVKATGAQAVTVARSEHYEYLHSIGADKVVDYSKQNVTSTFPEKFDLVLDLVGGKTLKEAYGLVKQGGRLVSTVEGPDQNEALRRGIAAVAMLVEGNGRQLSEIAKLIEERKVKPPKIEEFNLEEAALAHRKSESLHMEGKLVLKCREDQQ